MEGDGFLQGQWLPQGKGGFQISWEEGSSVDSPQMSEETSLFQMGLNTVESVRAFFHDTLF